MTRDPLMLIALIGAHFYFDYAGQGDFMAKAKNLKTPIPGIPYRHVLLAHACIHGAAAALITGMPIIFIGEALIHYVTDDFKCRGRITFAMDQGTHVVCKLLWFALAVMAAA